QTQHEAPKEAPKETVAANEPKPAPPSDKRTVAPAAANPVLQSQMQGLEVEIRKHKEERQRLSKLMGNYQNKLEAIPLREQQITQLVRDYEISKAHYSQLLDKHYSAETATQLEIRQKSERFSILDPAQPAERPSWPDRKLYNIGGG